jgi:hypothetical protein
MACRRASCPSLGSVVVAIVDPLSCSAQPGIQSYLEVPHRVGLNGEAVRRTESTSSANKLVWQPNIVGSPVGPDTNVSPPVTEAATETASD